MSGATASERVSGPVLTSLFLFFPDHSAACSTSTVVSPPPPPPPPLLTVVRDPSQLLSSFLEFLSPATDFDPFSVTASTLLTGQNYFGSPDRPKIEIRLRSVLGEEDPPRPLAVSTDSRASQRRSGNSPEDSPSPSEKKPPRTRLTQHPLMPLIKLLVGTPMTSKRQLMDALATVKASWSSHCLVSGDFGHAELTPVENCFEQVWRCCS